MDQAEHSDSEAARAEIYLRGTWRDPANEWSSSSGDTTEVTVPTSPACPARTKSGARRIAYLVRHAAQAGTITGPVTTDMAKVRQRKRDMVEQEIAAYLAPFKSSGAELVIGSGNFVAPKTLDVQLNDGGTRRLAGDKVFVDVGSRAAMPSIPAPLARYDKYWREV